MIHVDRQQIDERGTPIQPDQAWFDRAAKARARAETDGPSHKATASIYGDRVVRAALEKLFADKCAYCECSLAGFDWEVEHYRPKGAVYEDEQHGGYYWLAYEWNNLYPSCTHCNQYRNERPRWGDMGPLGRGGKATHFPLFNERGRATTDREIARERPKLLSPCDPALDPENHLCYDPFGNVHPYRRSRRGRATRDVLFLQKKRLRNERRQVIGFMVKRLRMVARAKRNRQRDAVRDFEELVRELTDGSHRYSGAARDVVRGPRRYGV